MAFLTSGRVITDDGQSALSDAGCLTQRTDTSFWPASQVYAVRWQWSSCGMKTANNRAAVTLISLTSLPPPEEGTTWERLIEFSFRHLARCDSGRKEHSQPGHLSYIRHGAILRQLISCIPIGGDLPTTPLPSNPHSHSMMPVPPTTPPLRGPGGQSPVCPRFSTAATAPPTLPCTTYLEELTPKSRILNIPPIPTHEAVFVQKASSSPCFDLPALHLQSTSSSRRVSTVPSATVATSYKFVATSTTVLPPAEFGALGLRRKTVVAALKMRVGGAGVFRHGHVPMDSGWFRGAQCMGSPPIGMQLISCRNIALVAKTFHDRCQLGVAHKGEGRGGMQGAKWSQLSHSVPSSVANVRFEETAMLFVSSFINTAPLHTWQLTSLQYWVTTLAANVWLGPPDRQRPSRVIGDLANPGEEWPASHPPLVRRLHGAAFAGRPIMSRLACTSSTPHCLLRNCVLIDEQAAVKPELQRPRGAEFRETCVINAYSVWGKREITDKIRRPAASSGTIPTCENPIVTRLRLNPVHLGRSPRATGVVTPTPSRPPILPRHCFSPIMPPPGPPLAEGAMASVVGGAKGEVLICSLARSAASTGSHSHRRPPAFIVRPPTRNFLQPPILITHSPWFARPLEEGWGVGGAREKPGRALNTSFTERALSRALYLMMIRIHCAPSSARDGCREREREGEKGGGAPLFRWLQADLAAEWRALVLDGIRICMKVCSLQVSGGGVVGGRDPHLVTLRRDGGGPRRRQLKWSLGAVGTQEGTECARELSDPQHKPSLLPIASTIIRGLCSCEFKVKKRGNHTGDSSTHSWHLITPTRKTCSVSVHIAELDISLRSPLRRVPIRPEHHRERVTFCQERTACQLADWRRFVFSDESRFCLDTNDHRIRACRPSGQRRHSSFIVKWQTAPRVVSLSGVTSYGRIFLGKAFDFCMPSCPTGETNGRSLRKPADQADRPLRFPHAGNRTRLSRGRRAAQRVGCWWKGVKPGHKQLNQECDEFPPGHDSTSSQTRRV
ncbi:hypothetical protein PR048_002342 [Dryococelus australis]|uniref:Uncharacterized protein n=1 Tax=Dryococelus australis TaxID=614101 RepID=A0ABQ9IK30_9NEOP|nr:hypothetical protein PR048_002342 [Dryococelus australis]